MTIHVFFIGRNQRQSKKIYNNLHIIYHIQLTKLDPNTYTFNPLNIKIE